MLLAKEMCDGLKHDLKLDVDSYTPTPIGIVVGAPRASDETIAKIPQTVPHLDRTAQLTSH